MSTPEHEQRIPQPPQPNPGATQWMGHDGGRSPAGAPPGQYPPPSAGARRSVGAIVTAMVCALVAVAGIGASGLAYTRYADERESATTLRQEVLEAQYVDDREQAAVEATRAFVTLVSTYDHTDLDSYFDSVLAATTGSWHESFAGSRGALREAMMNVQVSSRLDEVHCGFVSMAGTTARTIAIAKQTRGNATVESESLTLPMVVTLEEQADGRWLVSKLDSPAL
ncbi:hypothetical protein [Nocardia otitidiscaviarum]|uniref:hypothetical protein n=1 Tax=Nocardia otitidiscaviarum TaxID=1823 RepID=UPI001894DBB1|nr:hypothetical protein [Nocardia otitidiscaviarum]MBF6182196.1 hypothetical protein [Nocardia otitidiscaviarum]